MISFEILYYIFFLFSLMIDIDASFLWIWIHVICLHVVLLNCIVQMLLSLIFMTFETSLVIQFKTNIFHWELQKSFEIDNTSNEIVAAVNL